MIVFTLLFVLVVVCVITCDFSYLTLSDNDKKLLYVPDDYTEEVTNDNLFGTNTIKGEVDERDLVDVDVAKQAEEALERIYNGGSK